MKNTFLAVGLVLSLGFGKAYAADQSGAAVKPGAAAAEAKNPSPTSNASKKTTVGKGKTAVNTANKAGDDDSFWVEEIDIDGDGNVEESDVLYDDEDKILFFHADGEVTCKDGGKGEASLLVAVNQEGNSRGKPAGSGWYVVALDAGECKAEAAALYGCNFDANGEETECGVAVIDEKNDTITIVTASQK
jgi:hypothetical protein